MHHMISAEEEELQMRVDALRAALKRIKKLPRGGKWGDSTRRQNMIHQIAKDALEHDDKAAKE